MIMDSEVKDLLKLMQHLTSVVQIRNAAKIQALQGPTVDREVWVQVYDRCIVEVEETEGEIVSILPSGQFQRRLFISLE